MQIFNNYPMIGIVGVCGSGKTTLCSMLKQCGLTCRAIAQEHSYVKDMWQRLTRPRYLVYLTASFETASRRRKLNWTENEYQEQLRRLDHAKRCANLVVATDNQTPEQIFNYVRDQLKI